MHIPMSSRETSEMPQMAPKRLCDPIRALGDGGGTTTRRTPCTALQGPETRAQVTSSNRVQVRRPVRGSESELRKRRRTQQLPDRIPQREHLGGESSHHAKKVWILGDSNSRHLPCKGSALPTELRTRSLQVSVAGKCGVSFVRFISPERDEPSGGTGI
jgi:hypothetical protein